MTTENEWVKLPEPPPKALPRDTLIKLCSWCREPLYWAATSELVAEHDLGLVRYRGLAGGDGKPASEFVVGSGNIARVKLPPGYRFEGREVVKNEPCEACERGVYHQGRDGACKVFSAPPDDLGDTPQHLRPLLKAARERVPGTVITEARVPGWDVLWNPDPTKMGYPTFLRGDPSKCGYRIDAPPGCTPQPRSDLRKEILEGRCYPTADARRIGREEFGLKFYSGGADSIARRQEATRKKLDAEALSLARDLGMKPEALERLESAMRKPEPTRVLTSPIVIDDRPRCVTCSKPMDPRSDGDPTCSPECHQAHLGAQRRYEADRKHEASEEVYRAARDGDRERRAVVPLDVRITDAGNDRATVGASDPYFRAPGPGPKALNRAALPGVAGVRGKRKAETTAPPSWPADSGEDYEL